MRLLHAVLLASTATAQAPDLTGFISLRGVNATGPDSWLDGHFGRLEAGGDQTAMTGLASVGVDWAPLKWLELHVSGVARDDDAGLVEAHVDVRREVALDELRLRAGWFFLPTSRENRDANWASPYTISFSALNTWMAQEVRPVGIDLQYRHTTDRGHAVTGGMTAFRGNDTMGTLLGWRGWSLGDRVSTWAEVLPLPPLGSLQGPFVAQRDDGTRPFGSDLDGHTGYAARLRYSVPQRGNVQYTYVDNNGDRELHGLEYAWDTRFHLLGGEVGRTDGFTLAAEYLFGKTVMGVPTGVAAEFWTAYLLASHKHARNRWSARYELFHTGDEDHTPGGENNDESGRAWTLAWLYDVTPTVRAAFEFTQVTGDRAAARQYGFEPSTTAHAFTLELRYSF